MGQLIANGKEVVHEDKNDEGNIVVINTCGFIGKAKAVKNIASAFSNTPKQFIAKATRTKNVPVVGKPGRTVSVPNSSSTQQVSYANPRISMTAAERAKAGY